MKINSFRLLEIFFAVIVLLSLTFNIVTDISVTVGHYSWPTVTVTFVALGLLAGAIDHRLSKLEKKINKEPEQK
jgi:hypothetical protein